MESFLIVGCLAAISVVFGTIYTQEGCYEGWVYYNQMCYLYNPHSVDAMDAKDICSTYKDSTLASIWDPEESQFLVNTLLPPLGRNLVWIGLVPKPNQDDEWSWLDNSIAEINHDGNTPSSNTDLCGAMNRDGTIDFRNCWEVLPGFICKQSLDMTYIVSDLTNESNNIVADPPKMLFERVWPPKLQDLPQYIKHMAHIQVSAVSHETDCAFYCSHVNNCYGFTIHCSVAWKCNQYACDLFQLKP